MKFGLFTYQDRNKKFNVGDHIQSLAARQYLPRVDVLIDRDSLNSINLKNDTAVIMNGWFTHKPENWPPVSQIKPLFVSFHLNAVHAPKLLNKKENIEYLKAHSPIGCRDTGTVKVLKEKGIDAYYSSCLTTTLGLKYSTETKREGVYMVDVLYKDDLALRYSENIRNVLSDIKSGRIFSFLKRKKAIKSIIPEKILKESVTLTHSYWNKDYSEEERFELAEELLQTYSSAKLVITSRIHCALPCLALGTPVIFIAGGGLFKPSEMSRLKGTIEHLNVISTDEIDLDENVSGSINLLDPNNIDWYNIKNPTSFKSFSDSLKEKCLCFINSIKR